MHRGLGIVKEGVKMEWKDRNVIARIIALKKIVLRIEQQNCWYITL